MISIDSRRLKGGGQILRTALALSALTQQPFTIKHIRHGRKKPGLRAQHLYGVRAAAEWCSASVEGDELNSEKIVFSPNGFKPRNLKINMETAGSISLLLQCLLPIAAFAKKKVNLELTGGTDGMWAPPIDYASNVLSPHLSHFASISMHVQRRGYFPRGNGLVCVTIKPKVGWISFEDGDHFLTAVRQIMGPIDLSSRGSVQIIKGVSHASSSLQKRKVAHRQAKAAAFYLSSVGCPINITQEYQDSESTGSGITLWAQHSEEGPLALGYGVIGERGITAEDIGRKAAEGLLKELSHGGGADRFLSDQMIPFLALLPGSSLRTDSISDHCRVNCKVVEKFLPVRFSLRKGEVRVKDLS